MMRIHPARNSENIAHVNQQHSPIQQLLRSPMDNNKTLKLVSFCMVQMDNGSMETMDAWQHRFIEAKENREQKSIGSIISIQY